MNAPANPSFDFEQLDLFTVGTLGPTGQRTFFLQGRSRGELVSLKLEKQQVAALAEYLDRVLDDLPDAEIGPVPDDLDLREPVVTAWTIGPLAVAYATEADRLVVIAEELVEDDDDPPASARFALRREQVIGFIDRARQLVAAGRPPCPFCARPLEAHNDNWCPCLN
ncbi:MAG: DUF3090 family protein [Acidimicrobiales bacterium]